MYNCFDIANYFVELAKKDGQVIGPMKLLKLTYIAHGYYLAFTDKPLFDNKIEAWKYGPVIPDLYHIIKRTKFSDSENNLLEMYSNNTIKSEDDKFLKAVWGAYKNLSGVQLSSLTHKEGTPWQKVYNGDYFKEIDDEIIKSCYKQMIHERKAS